MLIELLKGVHRNKKIEFKWKFFKCCKKNLLAHCFYLNIKSFCYVKEYGFLRKYTSIVEWNTNKNLRIL